MDIAIKTYGKIVKLSLQGNLNSSTAGDFIEYTKTQLELGSNKFIIDCSFLEHISSSGISSLIQLNDLFKTIPALFVLIHLNEEILMLLNLFGLNKKFIIRNSILEAEEDLNDFNKQKLSHSSKEFSKIRVVDKTQGPTSFYSQKDYKEDQSQMKTLKTLSIKNEPLSSMDSIVDEPLSIEQSEGKIILCSFCDSKVRVNKNGKYRCPHCYKIFIHKN